MLQGRCLCGAVSYTLEGELLYLYNCHCAECRAFSGASFATNASVETAAFALQDPGDRLRRYATANGGGRYFCSDCGSPIYSAASDGQAFISLHCGSLEAPPDKALDANVWVEEKCPWVDIDPELNNFDKAFS